jgi:hypothetical protein
MELVVSKRKIEALEHIGAGKIINISLDKIIKTQIAKYKIAISHINNDLVKFEAKFNLLSSDFYSKYENGNLGDKQDFIEWAGLYENILLYNERIKMLESALKL